jgi:tetratricopeptide (TPR) repeat protein
MTERLPDLAALVTFDDLLREVPTDRPALERAAALASEQLEDPAADERERLLILGYLGNVERILGRHGEAIVALRECVELAGRLGDHRAEVVARIRLGEALRCADRLAEAEAVLRAVVEDTQGQPLHDFALQHLGKCLTDEGRAGEAIAVLDEALQLRLHKGDGELVASTELALERARSLRA